MQNHILDGGACGCDYEFLFYGKMFYLPPPWEGMPVRVPQAVSRSVKPMMSRGLAFILFL